MTERQGLFTIPTRLYLTLEQREQLEQVVVDQGIELPDLVSQVVVAYLGTLPALPPLASAVYDRAAEVRQRRVELRRLHARRSSLGAQTPGWFDAYIAELEGELREFDG